MKKLSILLISLLILLLPACSGNVGKIEDGYTNFGNLKLPQFQPPKEGEEIAVIRTSAGLIKVKLLDEVAPIGVEYFKKWVDEGKYEDSLFSQIRKDRNTMIQAKDHHKNMTKEELDDYFEKMIDEMSFEDNYTMETNSDYLNFSGAVGFANYSSKEMESRPLGNFYIVANGGLPEETLELMETMGEKFGFTEDIIKAYGKIGGIQDYNGNFTVFGQVFYGMDIVYKIVNMELDESGYPIEDPVRVEKIEILQYKWR